MTLLLPARTCCERATRVYVLRHGQSTYNAEGRFQGCADDSVLTPIGAQTAKTAAEYLCGADLDVIITSPLRRASRTAVCIYNRVWKGVKNPAFALDRELREIELPLWEGRSRESVEREDGDRYRVWRDQPHLFCMPERRRPVGELFARAERFWRHLLNFHAGKNVLLVTHSGTGRALIGTALGVPLEHFHAIQQSNGGLSILEFPDHELRRARLCALNATDYLRQKLPKLKDSKTGLRLIVLVAGTTEPNQTTRVREILQSIQINAGFGDSLVDRKIASALLANRTHVHESGSVPVIEAPAGSLRTILWVAQSASWRRILADSLALHGTRAERLVSLPFTFAVLHYPEAADKPILQAVNLHDTRRFAGAVHAQTGSGAQARPH